MARVGPPAMRLLVLGAALLAAERGLSARAASRDATRVAIHVGAGQIESARRAFLASAGRAPDQDEQRGLVAAEIDDEILYREALARGLDRDDPVVQRRLVTNMRFVDEAGAPDAAGGDAARYGAALALGMDRGDVVVRRRLVARMRALLEEDARRVEPTEAELQLALERHGARFASPPRVSLTQVLVPDDHAGGVRAQALLDGLAEPGAEPAAVAGDQGEDGDALPRPSRLARQSERDLARLFGAPFARQVFALPPARWSGPIASPHGQHLVWVHEHQPVRTAPLATVRNQVRELVLRERAEAAVRAAIDRIRARYDVAADAFGHEIGG